MSLVLTLIAGETARGEAGAAANTVVAALARAGARPNSPDWLAPDIACDILFEDRDADVAEQATRGALLGGFDLVIQPVAGRRKRLLVCDMEATAIENEMLDEMAALAGLGDGVAAVTRRAMNGEIDFAAALEARVALFKGRPESLLAEAAARLRDSRGARRLVKTMKAGGARTILVSGGFHVFADAVRDRLGFDAAYANELIVENGVVAGTVRPPIVDGAAKKAILRQTAAELGIDPAETLAVGDGANDLPMLEAAGLGIAYHAKPHLRARIRSRIDHADLTALLYLQGYRAVDLRD
jgi:phosphoserine phosphatase